MSRYGAVLFDAGDTLLDFYTTGDRVTWLVYEHTGRQIPAAEARPYFETAFHFALARTLLRRMPLLVPCGL